MLPTTIRSWANAERIDTLIRAAREDANAGRAAKTDADAIIEAYGNADAQQVQVNREMLQGSKLQAVERLQVLFARVATLLNRGEHKVDLSPEAACSNIGTAFTKLLDREIGHPDGQNAHVAKAVRQAIEEYVEPNVGQNFGQPLSVAGAGKSLELGTIARQPDGRPSIQVRDAESRALTTFTTTDSGEWLAVTQAGKVELGDGRISELKALQRSLSKLSPKPVANAFVGALGEHVGGQPPFAQLLSALAKIIVEREGQFEKAVESTATGVANAFGSRAKRISDSDMKELLSNTLHGSGI